MTGRRVNIIVFAVVGIAIANVVILAAWLGSGVLWATGLGGAITALCVGGLILMRRRQQ